MKKRKVELKGKDVLALKMQKGNDADASTIHDYFKRLIEELWSSGEAFSGKRPFGNSGWEYELYTALGQNNAIDVKFDAHGHIEEFLEDAKTKADRLIFKAIDAL